MAAADITGNAQFNKKKGVRVGVFDLDYTDVLVDGSIVANIPPKSIITEVIVIEKTAANVGATVDVVVGSTVIVDELPVDASGKGTVIVSDLSTGGQLIIRSGTTAPSQGTYKFLVSYIEYDRAESGEYTN